MITCGPSNARKKTAFPIPSGTPSTTLPALPRSIRVLRIAAFSWERSKNEVFTLPTRSAAATGRAGGTRAIATCTTKGRGVSAFRCHIVAGIRRARSLTRIADYLGAGIRGSSTGARAVIHAGMRRTVGRDTKVEPSSSQLAPRLLLLRCQNRIELLGILGVIRSVRPNIRTLLVTPLRRQRSNPLTLLRRQM